MNFASYVIGAIFLALFFLAVRRIIRKGPCDQCHGGCGCHCAEKQSKAVDDNR